MRYAVRAFFFLVVQKRCSCLAFFFKYLVRSQTVSCFGGQHGMVDTIRLSAILAYKQDETIGRRGQGHLLRGHAMDKRGCKVNVKDAEEVDNMEYNADQQQTRAGQHDEQAAVV